MDDVNAERLRNVNQTMPEGDDQIHEPVRIPRKFGPKPTRREGRVAPQDERTDRQGAPEPAAKLLGREVTGAIAPARIIHDERAVLPFGGRAKCCANSGFRMPGELPHRLLDEARQKVVIGRDGLEIPTPSECKSSIVRCRNAALRLIANDLENREPTGELVQDLPAVIR